MQRNDQKSGGGSVAKGCARIDSDLDAIENGY